MRSNRACSGLRPNANRERILSTLGAFPGQSFRAVARLSNLASGTARHHLELLVRNGFAWREHLGGRDAYFAGARPRQAEERALKVAQIVDALDRAILEVLANGPVRGQASFFAALPRRPRATIQVRLRRLTAWGILAVTKGRANTYRLSTAPASAPGTARLTTVPA